MVRRLIPGVWLLVLVALATYSGWRTLSGTAFESNIMGLVPGASHALQDSGVRERFERRFVVLVSGPDQARGLELARRLRSALARAARDAALSPPTADPGMAAPAAKRNAGTAGGVRPSATVQPGERFQAL